MKLHTARALRLTQVDEQGTSSVRLQGMAGQKECPARLRKRLRRKYRRSQRVILPALTWLSLVGLLASIARLRLTKQLTGYSIYRPMSNIAHRPLNKEYSFCPAMPRKNAPLRNRVTENYCE